MENQNIIKPNEITIGQYAKSENLTKAAVYNRMYRNAVKWRYLFPETKEYVVIEVQAYVPKKSGRKRKTPND